MAGLRTNAHLEPKPRKRLFTIERALLAAFLALMGFGLAPSTVVTVADNDTTKRAPQPPIVASRPLDYTAIGSIPPITPDPSPAR